jgi:hypothetical protein
VPDAIYQCDGAVVTPTEWAGSPWSRELQHGGPICGLVARSAEAAAQETGHAIVRLGVDLCRPTPFAPLGVVRSGRRLTLIEVEISSGTALISRGSALLLAEHGPSAGTWVPDEPPPPGPEGAEPFQFMPREYLRHVPPGFHRSVEVRLSEDEFGPAVWLTTPLDLVAGEALTTPLDLVAGEATSSLVRAAMLSDLTFAMAGRTLLRRRELPEDARRVPLINADMTLYLERPPLGEWIAFRRGAVSNQRGIGLAEVHQLDAQGRYGRSLQALVANP